MGMFDNFECEIPLPLVANGYDGRGVFQTKDLECEMGRYQLTKAGRLRKIGPAHFETRESFETPEYLAEYHGHVHFYGTHRPNGGVQASFDDVYVGYRATFTFGVLVRLQMVEKHRANPPRPSPPFDPVLIPFTLEAE